MTSVLEDNERTNRWMRRLAAIVGSLLLVIAGTGLVVEIAGLQSSSRQRNLLISCTTPGPKPPPATGHGCWDRLHDPKATGDAVAVIVDDIYCDQRRAQAKLPAVADPTKPCRNQTDPSIYPGSHP